ncbi:MAG: hypothetical protein AAF570_01675, partial [Bacteroidota bacterium]
MALVFGGWKLQAQDISVVVSDETYADPIVQQAVDDAMDLLEQACHCRVRREKAADVIRHPIVIQLHDPNPELLDQPTEFAKGRDYPYFHYPRHDFYWKSFNYRHNSHYQCSAPTPHGLANGLYALLQEKLDFSFVHPRQTVMPCWAEWPLPQLITFSGRPIFDKKGFHLHTQHPLE